MKTEMGEYIVGAYLKVVKKCDFVDYNVRSPVSGLEGLGELDSADFRAPKKVLSLLVRDSCFRRNDEWFGN